MANPARIYGPLPLRWKADNLQQNDNDRRWLENTIRNAAPGSDWWAKARIVQLAYPCPVLKRGEKVPKVDGVPLYDIYQGLTEPEIVETLHRLCPVADHPELHRQIDDAYVVKTLNYWNSFQFTRAISRNFEVYAHRQHANVFLVVSTTPVSLGVDRVLPPAEHFRPLFNVDEFAQFIRTNQIRRITLRTHGYANPASSFYQGFEQEANALNQRDRATDAHSLRDGLDHLYIGYHWPSEQPVTSPGLWQDYRRPMGVLFKFVVSIGALAGIFGTFLYLFLKGLFLPALRFLIDRFGLGLERLAAWANFWETMAVAVQLFWIIPTVFMMWVLVFFLLRIVVYQRDRYRAIHYGAPDLAEFFWRLDESLNQLEKAAPQANPASRSEADSPPTRLAINLVGHSMGALVLVNTVRLLSESGRDQRGTLIPDANLRGSEVDLADDIGDHLELDKLILASPDIPLEFLREGRNNYVRSAIRRCRRIYLMSSDRDIVLRYLSTVGNWFIEPSIQMAGQRLGNVYLKPYSRPATDQSRPPEIGGPSSLRPYIRIMIHSQRAVQPASAYDLFRKFNYIDCSRMQGDRGVGGVNSVPLPLNPLTALPIDLLNTAWYLLGSATGVNQLDVHGGYFQVQTPSFRILKFLLVADTLPDEAIHEKIRELIHDTPIRFFPSQPWVMPSQVESPLEQTPVA